MSEKVRRKLPRTVKIKNIEPSHHKKKSKKKIKKNLSWYTKQESKQEC